MSSLPTNSLFRLIRRSRQFQFASSAMLSIILFAACSSDSNKPAVNQSPTPTSTPISSPSPTPNDCGIVSTSATTLNLRKTASTQGKIIGKLKKGDKVTIKERAKEWFYVSTSSDQGYVAAKYIADCTESTTTPKSKASPDPSAPFSAPPPITKDSPSPATEDRN